MITILAICDHRDQDWAAVGHVRETAEEAYKASASFFPKPLYRVVVTPKYRPIRDAIMDLATMRLPAAVEPKSSTELCGRCSGSIARICEFHGCQIQSITASEES